LVKYWYRYLDNQFVIYCRIIKKDLAQLELVVYEKNTHKSHSDQV
jgi:hypothetical protein